MTLTMPFPMQKSDIAFGYDHTYEMMRSVGGSSEGIVAFTDFAVTQNATPNLTVDVATGYAWVTHETPWAGVRLVRNAAVSNSGSPGSPGADWLATFTAAHSTNPRIDRVVLTVRDGLSEGAANYDAKMTVLPGTATAGATLANLTGAAAVPANSLLLANVLLPAAATTIVTANIDTVGDGYSGGTPIRPRMMPNRACVCKAGRAADVALVANTLTDITFDFESFDTDGMTTATATNITFRTPGYYLVRCHAEFAYSASGGYRGVYATCEDGFSTSMFTPAVATASFDTRIEAHTIVNGGVSGRRWVKPQVISNIALNLLYLEMDVVCVGPLTV